MTKETHQLNGGAIINLAENTYDELGRLKTNKKGELANLNTTYAYNIRSWIKAINSPVFTEALYYNESFGGSAKLYNGNLSAVNFVVSNTSAPPYINGYAFSYDNLSRLYSANYLENGANKDNYKVLYPLYDKNGNIKALQRFGKTTATGYGLIDYLSLDYTGNQLLKVEDTAPTISIAESGDFKNYSNTTPEYVYNANGAMTKDLNKGISDIQYNSLNLPRIMDIKSPVAEARNEYTYSATGEKLKMVQRWNPNYSTAPVAGVGSAINTDSLTMSKTIYYAGNMIYNDRALKRILIDGGYIEGGVYYYYITDHQGNNRLVVNSSGTVVQKNHYYPFGMAFAETPIGEQGLQPYKYNGKELDPMSGLNQYDYGARFYDPAIGRYSTPDPLCEKYYSISPYAYCANNPVNRVDPTGMDWYMDEDGTYQYNPDLTAANQSTLLKAGQSYVGGAHQIKDKMGNVIENYRKDGSIMYSNEASGYRRMWNNSTKTKQEEMGIITDKGVLVIPSYKNKGNEVDISDYDYTAKNGNIVDAKGTEFNTIALIHTHYKGGPPSTYIMGQGYGDLAFATFDIPYKPFYVLRMNGENSISFIVAAPNPTRNVSDFKFKTFNITDAYPAADMNSLLTGHFSLIQYTKSNNFRKILTP